MKIKELAEDFKVEEIIDVSNLDKQREEKPYLYYYLTKKNYSQAKAIDIVAQTFNTTHKFVHVAGTKDRRGITIQVIAIAKSKRMQPEKHLEFFNSKFEDMNLKYIGEYPFRLNLGDNQGNRFEIVVRELSNEEISSALNRVPILKKDGVLNFYDSQRFGFGGNSHLIGKAILKGEIEEAVKIIITSMPEHANEEHKEFVESVEKHWSDIVAGNQEVIKGLVDDAPKFLRQESKMIMHFHNHKGDVSGALRLIPKKLRTLYIGAYQAYLFNSLLKENSNLAESVELCTYEINRESFEFKWYKKKLKEDNLDIEDFKLPHMPELKPESAFRETRVSVEGLEIGDSEDDELDEGYQKLNVAFSLGAGAYATNVVKQLFE